MAARLIAILVLLLLAAPPARAQRACPDILLGDSLAVGMGKHARGMGFEVIARGGAGIAWLREQTPRCAERLVLVFGTNDLRGLTAEAASAYVGQIAEVMSRWPARRIIWATPGCFARDRVLEQGSLLLDQAIATALRDGSEVVRHLPAVHRGRTARCTYPTADGVHPTAPGYRAWWDGLAPVIGPACGPIQTCGPDGPPVIGPPQRPVASSFRRADAASGMPSAASASFQPSASAMSVSVPGAMGRP